MFSRFFTTTSGSKRDLLTFTLLLLLCSTEEEESWLSGCKHRNSACQTKQLVNYNKLRRTNKFNPNEHTKVSFQSFSTFNKHYYRVLFFSIYIIYIKSKKRKNIGVHVTECCGFCNTTTSQEALLANFLIWGLLLNTK